MYLTRLETEIQKKELENILGKENHEMVWMFYAGFTEMTRAPIQSVLSDLKTTSQPYVMLPVHARRDLYFKWMECHKHFMEITTNTKFSADFLLTLMLCCYEAKNPEACRVIADHYYPNNICRIEIPHNRATPYLLLAVSYFIAHSGKQWSLRCSSAIPSGVALICKYISDRKFSVINSENPFSLWVWCFVVKPPDINDYVTAIKAQPSLQWIHLLNGSYLGDECTIKLCKCLKFDSKVIRVELVNCWIGNAGLKSIGELLKVNSKILHIDIRKNKFSLDDFISFLLTIKEKTHVEYLLIDKQYSENTHVCEILQDINLKRSQPGQYMMIIEDH